ncbi:hypothetical protein PUN28_020869 [Cardiocondyla obscurior]|uniref:Uncharacterized protein n=1 Tax=Cardiocondyla obscurior TaxID=286306 RepID=A0AAW2E621_9HYME
MSDQEKLDPEEAIAAGSPDSTTSPERPRILKVKIFPPGQPLVLEPPRIVGPPPGPKLPPLEFRPWTPCALRLPPPRFTRPPKVALLPGDIRTYRLTSPRYRVPGTPQPLPVSQGTQTENLPATVAAPPPRQTNAGTQTDPWATSSASESEPILYPGDEQWGPIRVTLTAPHISYRERRV